MMASRGCSILGSGTLSQRMSPLPCQVSAFIVEVLRCVADEKIERGELFLTSRDSARNVGLRPWLFVEVSVTCLMPGATETEFFRRADMRDTKVGTAEKDDAAMVAKTGFDAMMRGDGDIVTGLKSKIQSAAANVTPAGVLARQHRKMAEPGSAKR